MQYATIWAESTKNYDFTFHFKRLRCIGGTETEACLDMRFGNHTMDAIEHMQRVAKIWNV